MDNTDTGHRPFRFSVFVMPMMAIGGALTAGLIIATDLSARTNGYSALSPDGFDSIEFVSRSDRQESRDLSDALHQACERTGCDADTLHPMILALVERMTPEDLEAALDAQARVRIESEAVRHRSLPGTPGATMAEIEILAAERITALYEMELAER